MDSKEVKLLLKEAREAIKNKDHKTALKHCKLSKLMVEGGALSVVGHGKISQQETEVLKHDRNNYNGLVLFGVALQESDQKDQAPKAFRKAIEASPKQILAWQGLASYYEKEEANASKKELLPVYHQLLLLENDLGKYTETCNKLTTLALKLDLVGQSIKILKSDNIARSPEHHVILWKTIASLLAQLKDLPDNLSELFETTLSTILKNSPGNDTEEYYKKYLKLLYKHDKLSLLLEEAKRMHELYPSSSYPLEWICKVYGEEVAHGRDGWTDVEELCDKLTAISPDSTIGAVARGALHMRRGDLVTALDLLKKAIEDGPNSWCPWALLGQCQLKLYNYSESEHYLAEALRLVEKQPTSDAQLSKTLGTMLIKAIALQDSEEKRKIAVDKGIQILKLDTENTDVLISLARAYIGLCNSSKVEQIIASLSQREGHKSTALFLTGLLFKSKDSYEQAVEKLNMAMLEGPDSPEIYLELGLLHWLHQEYNLSLKALLKATKLDPNCYVCYLYLGHYYSLNGKDLDKARRCYQKSFQLNSQCVEAGVKLCDIYRAQNNLEESIQLLNYVTQKAGIGGARWAWLRLGLCHTELGNYQEAIDSLRIAIRSNPNDSHCWESLADAYYARGAYTAALKSYQRVVELSPGAVYPAYQIASINQVAKPPSPINQTPNKPIQTANYKDNIEYNGPVQLVQLIGLYKESVQQFKELVANNPKYVPALKGLGEAWLCLARNYKTRQLIGCCKDSCQHALDSITSALEERRDLSCLWKLLGEVCCLATRLPDKVCQLSVSPWLTRSEPDDAAESVQLDRGKVFELATSLCSSMWNSWFKLAGEGTRLLGNVGIDPLSFLPIKSSAGLDSRGVELSINIRHYTATDNKSLSDNRPPAMLLDKKHSCLCTRKDIARQRAWRGPESCERGATEIKNYSLAQHAFIKSVNIESNNPVSWTNLGTLYLLLGELKLANEAFIVTQRTEPSYIQCWIGQALLAERVKNEDSMDLFRHTTQLGIHPESCIGYSQFVCSTLLNTSNTTDPRFVYSIEKMYAIPVAVDAMTYYTAEICDNPCAYNMLGLLLERQRLYRGAAEAFESALNLLQSEEQLSVRDKVLGNYGRVLVQLQRYDEAIKSYQQVKQANFYTQCGLALAYFKAEKYEDSYVAYETALEWLAPDDGFKSHVLVAMAAMTYMFQGVEDSKILLFQWPRSNIQLKPPSVQGLFASCALGMLHSDLNLSELTFKELLPYKDEPEFVNHIAVFRAYLFFLQLQWPNGLRPLALSSASLKLISWDGGWEGERHGKASQLTNVSFCANKNRWITETIDDASYQTGLAEKSYDQSRSVEAVRSLSNTVHRHPGIPELWLSLALLLLLLDPTNKAAAAGKCAQRAMVLGRSSMDVMSLVSLSHLLSGKATASICSSQKAVHMFPDIPENWVVLVASFLPWCIHRRSSAVAAWLKQLISHVRRKLESSRQMGKWLSNHEQATPAPPTFHRVIEKHSENFIPTKEVFIHTSQVGITEGYILFNLLLLPEEDLIYLRLQHFFSFFLPVFVNLALFLNDTLLLFPHHMPHSSQDYLMFTMAAEREVGVINYKMLETAVIKLNQNSLLEFEGFLLVFLFKS
uniref:Tetratricopeptide repeat protein 37 n=1 Tax=Timema poppense TaxID=170557 RepID=A0A7R9GWJ3_TIMPO|nr:unnamed protein product [Timema poppensis]